LKTIALFPANETVEINDGDTLLSSLRKFNVSVKQVCGGRGICATCHVFVRSGLEALAPPCDREARTLSFMANATSESRLACQAQVLEEGVVIEVPDHRYLENTSDLMSMVGDRAVYDFLHPITGAMLIPKGKIITRSMLQLFASVNAEVTKLKATAG
jgi:ferredoxin